MRTLAVAAVLLAAGAAIAAEKTHTVAAGESAASIAQAYYADAELGDLLLRYNGKTARMLHPGDKLSVPICDVVRARSGDTWSAIAKQRLGRTAAAPALAELNGSSSGVPLRVGARVVVPVVLRHTLGRGESLVALAQRYYGDPKKASLLKSFGRIDDAKRVTAGTEVEIPLVAFVAAERAPDAEVAKKLLAAAVAAAPTPAPTPAPVAPAPPAPVAPPAEVRRFEAQLVEAQRSFAEGEYDRAKEALEALREKVMAEGAESDRREWARLMAFTYVALDRDDDACTAYRTGPPQAGAGAFDPDLISPRIRTALSKCAAAGASAERLDNPAAAPQIPPHVATRG